MYVICDVCASDCYNQCIIGHCGSSISVRSKSVGFNYFAASVLLSLSVRCGMDNNPETTEMQSNHRLSTSNKITSVAISWLECDLLLVVQCSIQQHYVNQASSDPLSCTSTIFSNVMQ